MLGVQSTEVMALDCQQGRQVGGEGLLQLRHLSPPNPVYKFFNPQGTSSTLTPPLYPLVPPTPKRPARFKTQQCGAHMRRKGGADS